MTTILKILNTQRLFSGFVIGVVLLSAFFIPSLVSAQEEGSFDDIDDLYKEKVEQCAEGALMQLLIGAIISQFTSVPVVDGPQGLKEIIEDCLIWALKAALIETLTGRTVNWVQTGINGNPAFVVNVNDSLRDVADKAAGAYISQTVPFLCSPFQADIQLALTNYYRSSARIGYFNQLSCTLSDAVENIDAFVDGDFSAGGWGGWFEFVGNPYNNPIGAYYESTSELDLRVSSATGGLRTEINLGGGFFSKKTQTCYAFPADDQAGPPQPFTIKQGETAQEAMARLGITAPGGIECDPEQIVTPGDTIKTSLEISLGRNLDHIVSADEINEIITIAIGFITSNILSGDKGLAGYSSEDFPYTGSSTPGVDPSIDPTKPPVGDGTCGTGEWLLSNAETPGETLSLRKNGLVLNTGSNSQNVAFQLPGTEAERAYRRATMSVTVEVGDLTNGIGHGNEGQVHQLIYLQREKNPNNFKWPENNVGILNIQAERNRFLAGNNLNIRIGNCTNDTAKNNVTFETGKRYTFTYTYDTVAQTITTTVSGPGVNFTLQDTPTADMIQSNHPQGQGQAGFFVALGGPDQNDIEGHELPLINWKFYDLSVDIEY